MKAKEILSVVIDFLTSSPFEEEDKREPLTELEQMKFIKLYRQAKDYYLTRCINDTERFAEELTQKAMKGLITDKDRLNELYTKQREFLKA